MLSSNSSVSVSTGVTCPEPLSPSPVRRTFRADVLLLPLASLSVPYVLPESPDGGSKSASSPASEPDKMSKSINDGHCNYLHSWSYQVYLWMVSIMGPDGSSSRISPGQGSRVLSRHGLVMLPFSNVNSKHSTKAGKRRPINNHSQHLGARRLQHDGLPGTLWPHTA